MLTRQTLSATSVILIALVSLSAPLPAASPAARGLGDPGTLQAVVIETGREQDGGFTLVGPDSSQQLVVTGHYSSGQVRDLSRRATYEVTPADIAAVDRTGLITPLKAGKAVIRARTSGGQAGMITVSVSQFSADAPVSFPNHVVPILTRLGCNSGGCHGKAEGQNGFKLSLFGFEPGDDYGYLTREVFGRRVAPTAPAQSLLLLKATAQVAHVGGRRLDPDSPYYTQIYRWIAQGARLAGASEPIVQRIEVLPKERLLERNSQQQLVVVAHYNDGSTEDITSLARFDSNQVELAEVAASGLVSAQEQAGSAAIMVRYQGHVDVARILVPLGAPMPTLPPARNFVDELVFRQLQQLGLPPSEPCSDATFLRRATLDLAGRLPTKAEAEAFLADTGADKYDLLIDRLLASTDYADYFANKWSAILRNRRSTPTADVRATSAFHTWIRDSLQQNKPYDQFVREILTATGVEAQTPQLVWYRELKEGSALMEDAAQLFLGQRIQCARCHHHPFDRWSQRDYWALEAFFAATEVKLPPPIKPKKGQPQPAQPAEIMQKHEAAQAIHPRTQEILKPAGLGSSPRAIPADADPRQELASWMAARDNPFFARALVNRYWKHFFGRGLVDPEDDLRLTNPPTNPALLDALARHFIEHKYDLKDLIRTLCTSQVYRLSAVPNEFNAQDRQYFAHFYPRRLPAEVLLDAIDEVTLAKTIFPGVPGETRAVQLPDNQFDSYFLSVFGRPDAASPCECERHSDASLGQALHLFNSEEVLFKITGKIPVAPGSEPVPGSKPPKGKGLDAPKPSGKGGVRLQQLVNDKRPHEARIRDLYLIALAREPKKEELTAILAHLEKNKDDLASAYADLLWALLNTKEFQYNH